MAEKLNKAFGRRIREQRLNAGMSQEKLAEQANLHRTYIGSIERGEKNITLDTIFRIARGLNVEASSLIQHLEQNPENYLLTQTVENEDLKENIFGRILADSADNLKPEKKVTNQIKRSSINPAFINHNANLPYLLSSNEIVQGIATTYNLLYEINNFLVGMGSERLEDYLLGNSFSGIVSEFLVKNISNVSNSLVRNRKIGGHPDLIPVNTYLNDEILHGQEGIEVKASIQKGGWQGHNPELGWLLIFRYILDIDKNKPLMDREPVEFVQVLAAKLELEDWSFSGRSETSRRTITASITGTGMKKLRSNPIYENPKYRVKGFM